MNKGCSFTIICSSSILRYYAYNNSRYYETAHLSNFGINFHVTLNVKILDVFIFVRHKIENSIQESVLDFENSAKILENISSVNL